MRIGVGVPAQGSAATGSRIVIKLLTSEPWVNNRPDGHQAERVATSWAWDAKRTTLRLKLRRDIYFHDGDQLTPEIAARSLEETRKNARTDAFSFSSVKEIVPSGEDTIDIRLSEVNSFIVPDLSAVAVTKPDKPAIATGPFKVVSASPQGTKLAAFDHYYRGRPGVGAIDLVTYPTQRAAWSALMRGDIDMLHEVSRDAADFVEAETRVKAYKFLRPYYLPLVFNVRNPKLKNVEVRKAINEALDRAALVRDAMRNRGEPADGPIFPQHWSYSPPSEPFVFSPAHARERLDQAGFTAKAARRGETPIRLSFTCLVFADDTRFDRLAVLVQKQLADVGIDMKLQPLPQRELVQRIAKGDFDAFILEMAGRSLSWVYEFWRSHEGALINSGYTSADAILDRIRAAGSDEETRAEVAKLQNIMHDDPPAAFLTWQQTSRAVSTKFDVAPEENRDILTNLWQWRPARQEPQ